MKTSNSKWENGFWIGLTDMENEGNWTWINNVTEVQQRWEQHQSFLHTFMLNKLIILYILSIKSFRPCCYSSSYGYYLTIWCFLCILVERFSSCASFAVCLVICQCAPSVLCFISLSLCHVPMSVSVVQPVGSGFTFRVCVSCLLMLIRISCASCLPFLVVPLCVYL